MIWIGVVAIGLLVGIALYDLAQRQHAILRNFPVIGHSATGSRRSVPSSASTSSPTTTRSGRSAAISGAGSTRRQSARTTTSGSAPTTRWSCAELPNHQAQHVSPALHLTLVIRIRSKVPHTMREGDGRRATAAPAFRPASVVNVSGMSFGSLSGPAVEALNRGASSPAVCRARAKAACRRITSKAAISSGRSGPVFRLPRTRRSLQHGETQSDSCAPRRFVRSRSS